MDMIGEARSGYMWEIESGIWIGEVMGIEPIRDHITV